MARTEELAGRLSERVRFEVLPEGRGEAGEASAQWRTLAERWAAVEPVDRVTASVLAADTRHPARRWRVTLRDGIRVQLGMRLVWRGEALRISGIDRDPARPGLTLLWVEDPAA